MCSDSGNTVLALFIAGIITFVVQRRRRYKRQSRQQIRHIRHISAPNGLDPGPNGNIPPSYREALKSPVMTASPLHSSNHQRQRSDQALIDQCWAAVYQTEDGGSTGHHGRSTTSSDRSEPATPNAVLRNSQRQSVSQWLRDHLTGSGSRSSTGPLSSNPPRTPMSGRLPVPPSPSYAGVPATPGASDPQTPMSANYLAPLYSPYAEPLSARSWVTGEDRLSIRASIPNSVLYPSPLQPAPPPRRLSQNRRDRESMSSMSSVSSYGAGTWKTITPHEDPPEYEPRRGNPDSVSPV